MNQLNIDIFIPETHTKKLEINVEDQLFGPTYETINFIWRGFS